MSLDILFEAIITGFILSIMMGPAFFLLLETSIHRGIRAAMAFDAGILISDFIYIMIAYIFYAKVEHLSEGQGQFWLKIISGSLFLLYGLYTLIFKKVAESIPVDEQGNLIRQSKDYGQLVIKGFVLNMANPLVIFYWFSLMTWASRNTEEESIPALGFLGIVMLVFICFDMLKIVGAKKLRPLMTPRLLKGMNQLIGIVFIGFAVVLIIQGIYHRV